MAHIFMLLRLVATSSTSLLRLVLISTLLAVTACGGSSSSSDSGSNTESGSDTDTNTDSDTNTGDQTDTSTETETSTAVMSLRLIEGSVSDTAANALADAEISITLIDNAESELFAVSAYTDSLGEFMVQLPSGLEGDLSKAMVTAYKDGFSPTDYEYDIDTDTTKLSVSAMLSQAQSTSIKREDLEAIAVASDGVPVLRLALFGDSNGNKRLATGDAMPSDGEEEEFALEIPISDIDEDAEVINVSLSTYNSQNETDINSYSGDFEATGSEDESEGVDLTTGDDSTDSETTQLVSTAFFNVELTDQNGDALKASEAAASSGVGSTMYYQFSYNYHASTLYTDSAPSQEGVQFAFYGRNFGRPWKFVGNGTLVYYANGSYQIAGEDQGISIDANNNIAFDRSLVNNYRIYFRVKVMRWESWMQHLNVDRMATSLPTPGTYCVAGEIDYQGGTPYNGYAVFYGPDNAPFSTYVRNGEYKLYRTVVNDRSGGAVSAWSRPMRMYNRKSRRWEYVYINELGLANGDANMVYNASYSRPSSCNQLATIELYNPYLCQLRGFVYGPDGETPLGGEPVVAVEQSTGRRSSAITDSEGAYQIEASCNTAYGLTAVGQEVSVNAFPATSSPYTVNYTVENVPPVLMLFAETGDQEVNTEISSRMIARDADGDEISLAIKACEFTNTDGVTSSCAASLTQTAMLFTPTEAGDYRITVNAADEYFSVDQTVRYTAIVPETQYAPEVFGFEVNGNFVEDGSSIELVEGSAATVSVNARDRNGDAISYDWTINGESCSTSECTFVVPSIGDYVLDVTLTDDSDARMSESASFSIVGLENQLPQINGFYTNTTERDGQYYIRASGGSNYYYFYVRAWFQDDYTSASDLVYEITLSDDTGTEISSYREYRNDYSAYHYKMFSPGSMAVGIYTVSVSVTDTNVSGGTGNTVTETRTINVVEDLPPYIYSYVYPTSQLYGNDETAFGSLALRAYASDDSGVTAFEAVFPAGVEYTESTYGVWQYYQIDTSSLSVGSYEIQFNATDDADQTSSVTRTIDVIRDELPVIDALVASPDTVLADLDGNSASSVTVVYEASDDLGGTSVVNWTVSPPANYETTSDGIYFEAGALGVGTYVVELTVQDGNGQQTTGATEFEVIERDGNIEVIIE